MTDLPLFVFCFVDALLGRVRRWNYRANYLASTHWHKTRVEAIARAGRRCAECGNANGLDVHHKTYARIGHEQPEDLEVLCRLCHNERHALDNAKKGLAHG